jgi:hypothetical protein
MRQIVAIILLSAIIYLIITFPKKEKRRVRYIKKAHQQRTGIYPFMRPNPAAAAEMFAAAAATAPTRVEQADHVASYNTIIYHPILPIDIAGDALPPPSPREIALPVVEKKKDVPPPAKIEFNADKQNVHDHAVASTSLTNIQKLKPSNVDYLPLVLSENTNENIQMVLLSLSDHEHSRFMTSEHALFNNIYDFIMNIEDDEERKNALETFFLNLNDCVENNLVVCSSGKMERMISTLCGVHPEIQPIGNMSVFKQALADIASNVRDGEEKNELYDVAVKSLIQKMGVDEKVVAPIVQVYKEYI